MSKTIMRCDNCNRGGSKRIEGLQMCQKCQDEKRVRDMAPDMLAMLERLAEKVNRANILQHSRKSHTIPTEDWSELYHMTAEAKAIIARAKGLI